MKMPAHLRRWLLVVAIVPVFGFVLAGCSSTVDSKSAENVIKSQLGNIGPLKATSVSCPSGVSKKAGVSFSCKVTMLNTSNNVTGTGTITLHITNGGARAEFSASDLHFP